MKITEKEFNVLTGEETITEREETKTEKEFRLQHQKIVDARQAKEADKLAILDRIGLTADELKTLLGGN